MGLIQFKRIAVTPLTPAPAPSPTPTVADVVPEKPTFTIKTVAVTATDIGGQKTTVNVPIAPQNPTLGKDKPGVVTLLYNDSDTGIGYKEWATWRQGLTVVTSWGRCGTKLQRNYKTFRSEHEAQKTMEATIAQKRARGYRDTPARP